MSATTEVVIKQLEHNLKHAPGLKGGGGHSIENKIITLCDSLTLLNYAYTSV